MAMFNYESEALYQQARGETIPSSPVYVTECKKEIIDEVSPNYPQLVEYEKEWLNFAKYVYHDGTPVPLEYQELNTYGYASVENAIPFNYKSASLKGNTLVNMINNDNWSVSTSNNSLFTQNISIKKGQIYSVIGKIESKDVFASANKPVLKICAGTDSSGTTLCILQQYDTIIKQTFINNENETIHIRFFNQKTNYKKLMIIEGDYTNVDIPYFEGMKSVQMPILKSTGKNLFDVEGIQKHGGAASLTVDEKGVITIVGGGTDTESSVYTNKTVYLEKGKQYTFSCVTDGVFGTINGTDTVEAFLMEKDGSQAIQNLHTNPQTFTCTSTGDYTLRLDVNMGTKTHTFSNIQIEEGAQATFYEPFKSNILMVNEDVVLRGIGEVKDELNLLTGELTERIGEVVLDGSEEWVKETESTNTIRYSFPFEVGIDKMLLCSSFDTSKEHAGFDKELITAFDNKLYVRLLKSKASNVAEFKQYLSQNKATVQYPLVTESVKTVDLNQTIKPYEGINHYQVSSDTIPTQLLLTIPVVSTGAKTLNDIITEE